MQYPAYRKLDHRKNGRRCSGLILVHSGECHFKDETGTLTAHANDVVYLPLGSRHILTLTGDSPAFYRLDFLLYGTDGEPLFLSERPTLLARGVSEEFRTRVRALCEESPLNRDSLFLTEQVSFLLRTAAEQTKSEGAKRLQAAVCALHENFNEIPDVSHLAALSHLGTSRFYELFRQEYGCTPLAYRDSLLLDRAKALLRGGDLSVSEIATVLGFADAAYFSRFFKKMSGVAPQSFLLSKTDQKED